MDDYAGRPIKSFGHPPREGFIDIPTPVGMPCASISCSTKLIAEGDSGLMFPLAGKGLEDGPMEVALHETCFLDDFFGRSDQTFNMRSIGEALLQIDQTDA